MCKRLGKPTHGHGWAWAPPRVIIWTYIVRCPGRGVTGPRDLLAYESPGDSSCDRPHDSPDRSRARANGRTGHRGASRRSQRCADCTTADRTADTHAHGMGSGFATDWVTIAV